MLSRTSVAWTPGEPTEPDTNLSERIEAARQVLAGRTTAVLSGAGISTDSGIPDYRSPHAQSRAPMTIDAFMASESFRRHYWARNHLGWRHMDSAVPNRAHVAITRLQQRGAFGPVITQNVDMLHIKAGNAPVLELHGCYGRVGCVLCDFQISRHELAGILEPLNREFATRARAAGAIDVAPDADVVVDDTDDFVMIDCPRCAGALKPDIVYFGDSVPKSIVDQAYSIVDAADALIVVGSSLTVMSGLRFVRHAHQRGIPIVIVNRGATRGDDLADVKIDRTCTEVLDGLTHVL